MLLTSSGDCFGPRAAAWAYDIVRILSCPRTFKSEELLAMPRFLSKVRTGGRIILGLLNKMFNVKALLKVVVAMDSRRFRVEDE